jgi:transposase InsO family protein
LFTVWGLDAVGKFPRSVRGYKYQLIAIDKFTKWVEIKPVRALTAQAAVKFIQGIVCHFSVPNRIITDLCSQFTSKEFEEYCGRLSIRLCYAFVAHPRSNGQVKRANVEVLQGLQTTIFDMLDGCGKN